MGPSIRHFVFIAIIVVFIFFLSAFFSANYLNSPSNPTNPVSLKIG